MNLQENLLALGIDTKLLIAGIIGAIGGLTGKKLNWLIKISSFFTGVGAAIYLTPLAGDLLELKSEQNRLGLAVLIGYFGIAGLQKIFLKKIEEYGNDK